MGIREEKVLLSADRYGSVAVVKRPMGASVSTLTGIGRRTRKVRLVLSRSKIIAGRLLMILAFTTRLTRYPVSTARSKMLRPRPGDC